MDWDSTLKHCILANMPYYFSKVFVKETPTSKETFDTNIFYAINQIQIKY